MSSIRDERLKLLATTLNNVAVATFATTLIAPAASTIYGLNSPIGDHPWLWIGFCWFCGGMSLHLAVQMVLGRPTP